MYEAALKEKALPSSRQRQREGYLSLSEILLIEILFSLSPYKGFKHYYLYGICLEHRKKFRKLLSYQRFIALKKHIFMPLTILLQALKGKEAGIYFADSTTLKICHNKRASRHKVFEGYATKSKSTRGWFFGLKLHLIINHKGEIMAIKITSGNKDDRKALKDMVKNLQGKCYADKGYLGKEIFQMLWKKGLHLVIGIRKNMKQYLMPYIDNVLLRKRFIIETMVGVLKTSMTLEHTRHRSATNAFVQIMATLVAYSFKLNKPKIKTNLITA